MPSDLQRHADAPPLHVQLAQIMKERIHAGAWRTGEVIPTEKDLCAAFDVARGTLRQALHTLEQDGYLRRERGRGTFVTYGDLPTEPQQRSTTQRHLAFVVPYVRDSSVSTIFMGFQQVASEAGFSTSFSHVNNDIRQQARIIETLVADGVSGIALYPVDSDITEPLDRLVADGFPLVLVDRYLKKLSTDFVMTDHFGGAARGVSQLIDDGHERIGFATWLSPAISMEHRYLGYLTALRERDIEPDNTLICHVEGYPTIDVSPLRQLLDRPDRPTAVFTANDQIAIALYRVTASLGLRVPSDLAVVSFDNLDLAEQLDPPLTTVAQPFLEVGRKAAEVLLRRINGETFMQQITLSPQLILRESTLPLSDRHRFDIGAD